MKKQRNIALAVIGIVLFSVLAGIEGHHQKDLAHQKADIFKNLYTQCNDR